MAIEEAMNISRAKSRMLDRVQKEIHVDYDIVNVHKSDNPGKIDSDSVSEASVHTSLSSSAAVNQMVRKLNMPKVDLQPFSGDPLAFRRFMRQFNTSIAKSLITSTH